MECPAELFSASSPPPERDLWGAVLALLIQDAMHYHRGKRLHSAGPEEAQRAYQALIECDDMLHHCCQWTNQKPEAVSEAFRAWCGLVGAAARPGREC